MTRKDVFTFATIAILAAVISSVIAGKIFTSDKQRSEKAAVVEPISATLPDVNNSKEYKAFYNSKALNPTQLIRIGTSQNKTPFNQ